ncbi:MAG: DEAD/DEAH box helicase [Terriglobales bacterium]
MVSIHDILTELAASATSNRDKGDKFERLMLEFLKADPLYSDKFKNVWLWNNWPGRDGKVDTGIDIVAQERDTGEYCAIQCKFYASTYELQKPDIDSFFTASGKKPFTSRIIISTTDHWSRHAEDALEQQTIPVTRLRVQDLHESAIDWSEFSLERPARLRLKAKKVLFPHQKTALAKTIDGFKSADRGKLLMACGSGKTFTSLKITETLVGDSGFVLFLAPSISLISQTLKEWSAESLAPLRAYAVCSDTKVGKRGDSEDMSVHDLAIPATTDAKSLAAHYLLGEKRKCITVIFSTYHSIKVIHDAQKAGLAEFDLVVCDEAHRTTGATAMGEEESHFVRVHDAAFIGAKKRLYMTATPRIYSDASRTQAKESDVELCSMDDEKLYGKEFYRLGFGECVSKGLLSDYKVLVLAVDEKFVSKTFQRQLADSNNELTLEDAVKIVGCWNGLSKRAMDTETIAAIATDTSPMHRAVAFARSIKDSKKIVELFNEIVNHYKASVPAGESMLDCEVKHVDGTFNVLVRNERLDWLREDTISKGTLCRILSNARCLVEGVDVPALDAVIFLNPRDSVVDVVQSVGRVMRKVEGKQYGYIILPVGIPADITPEDALQDNKRFRVVWQVLQALRSHDDRFNALINKLELNNTTPSNLQIIGVGGNKSDDEHTEAKARQIALSFPKIEEWREAIYAKIVLKCGDRRYWETWAGDVAKIAETHISRIKGLLAAADPKPRKAFDSFLKGLRENLNPSITQDDAIEMLAQHLITKPVFDSLYEGYQFTTHNPVSKSMQKILTILEGQSLEKETASLDKFYASVRERASGIDNAAGKQKIIYELYEKFFRTAFRRVSDRLGIVYTPVEVVDFIIHSVNDALQKEFGVTVSDRNVHILDPFTGTGTFMVRLLQSGLIREEDLLFKYENELHANELVLLAYYIAAINIEEAYHGISSGAYQPFEGIVLTDTFQMTEGLDANAELDLVFPENNKRVSRQRKAPIRVVIGNPPYKAQQESENDNNKKVDYPTLDNRIRQSYAKRSNAGLVKNVYDSYIRAIRWASDRIKGDGIVGFVTNGSFIDASNMDGLRKCLVDEFTSIYCFNLRGNQRTSGEQSRKEGGKIFGSGSRAPIAITLLIKNTVKETKHQLFYHDIGDYFSREEKLKVVESHGSFKNIKWQRIRPNSDGDWINQRNPEFQMFAPLGDKSDAKNTAIFAENYSQGVLTARDAWTYNFSRENLASIMTRMISFYNKQCKAYEVHRASTSAPTPLDDFIDNDPRSISWTHNLKAELEKGAEFAVDSKSIVSSMYRPFCKQWLYFNRRFNERVYQIPRLFPNPKLENLVIAVTGIGANKEFSALMTDCVPNYHLHDTGQCFPLYSYQEPDESNGDLFGSRDSYLRRGAIPDITLATFRSRYEPKITKEDVFYYVYGVLHSPEYKERYAADVKKMIPRIPFAKDFWAFSNAGRKLAKWHLEYESVKPYPLREIVSGSKLLPEERYWVTKMLFGKKNGKPDKSTIIFNGFVTLLEIPEQAYEYVVNGKSAIEWIVERYQITTDQDSGITNDPNAWSNDDPRYIFDLLRRIVRVSIETVNIVKSLPALEESVAMADAK